MARKLDRITIEATITNGHTCIRGLRRVVEAAALYPDRNEFKRKYPDLEDEDIARHWISPPVISTIRSFRWKRRDTTAARPSGLPRSTVELLPAKAETLLMQYWLFVH